MRILVVQETDWVARNPVLHHRMLEELTRRGDEVRVIDFEIHWNRRHGDVVERRHTIDDCRKFFPDSSVRIVRPGMVRLPGIGRATWLLSNYSEIRRELREWKPDVVVAYGISNALVAQRLARKAGIPFVYHLLDALHTLAEPQFLAHVARPVEQAALRRADRIIVVNNHLREYAAGMGADRAKIEIIPMGTEARENDPQLGEKVREELGVKPDDIVMLFMGWLYTFSGLRELAASLVRRKDELPNVKLLIVGDGDLLDELRTVARRERLEDRIVLTGRRPMTEMPGFISAADFTLLPAHRNKTMMHIVPAKVIEYMELGKAVIATRLPGLEAEFGELPGMIYIDRAEDALDRVAAVAELPVPRDHARRLGRSCLDFMRKRETWDQVTARFRSELETVARNGARR